MKRRTFLGGLAAVLGGFAAVPVRGQASYPSRPVRIVLPFGPGGVADVTTRIVAEKLSEKLGQRFVVENQPGAGGIIAARSVLSAPADGYTLALFSNGTAISVSLFKTLPFDPLKDFVPISSMGYFDALLVTNVEAPYRTLMDFVQAAREKPGTLNVGTISVGSTQNLSAELLKTTAGVNFVIIPFKTSPDALVALLRNDVQMVIDFPPALKGALEDKKVRVLAATGPVSALMMPGVPTAEQAGVSNYDVTSWNAIYARAGTPVEIIEALNRAMREVLADPDVKKRALAVGIDARASNPSEMDARMRADIEKWAKVIAQAGIAKQ